MNSLHVLCAIDRSARSTDGAARSSDLSLAQVSVDLVKYCYQMVRVVTQQDTRKTVINPGGRAYRDIGRYLDLKFSSVFHTSRCNRAKYLHIRLKG